MHSPEDDRRQKTIVCPTGEAEAAEFRVAFRRAGKSPDCLVKLYSGRAWGTSARRTCGRRRDDHHENDDQYEQNIDHRGCIDIGALAFSSKRY